MLDPVNVTLGGVSYAVRRFNIAQRRDLSLLFARRTAEGEDANLADAADAVYDVLAIALRRADPPVADLNEIEATQAEIAEAFEKIMAADRGTPSPAPAA